MKIHKIIVNKLTKITLLKNENYTFINSKGELIQDLDVQIQGNKLVIKDLNTGESIELENYQQAHLVTLDSVQLTGNGQHLINLNVAKDGNETVALHSQEQLLSEEITIVKATTVEYHENKLLWWALGGLATLGIGTALLGGMKKKSYLPESIIKPSEPEPVQIKPSTSEIKRSDPAPLPQTDPQLIIPTIRIQHIADNDIINLNESQMDLIIKGEIKDLSDNIVKIVLLNQGKVYLTKQLDSQHFVKNQNITQFNVTLKGSDLSQNNQIKLIIEDEKGNVVTEQIKNYLVKLTTSDNLQLTIEDITQDNIINASEKNVDVQVYVKGLDADATGTLVLKDGETIVGSQQINTNQSVVFSLKQEQLLSKNLKAELQVFDLEQNTNIVSTDKTYEIDLINPSIQINNVIVNDLTFNQGQLINETVNIRFSVNQLEKQDVAEIQLFYKNHHLGTQTVSQNGEYSFTLNKEQLALFNVLSSQISEQNTSETQQGRIVTKISQILDQMSLKATVKDLAQNQIKVSQGFDFNTTFINKETLPLNLKQPQVEILTIAQDNIVSKQELKEQILIQTKVTNIEENASLTLKLYKDNVLLDSKTFNPNQDHLNIDFSTLGENLVGSNKLKIVASVSKEEFSKSNETEKTYEVKTTFDLPTLIFKSIADNNIINSEKMNSTQYAKIHVSQLSDQVTGELAVYYQSKEIGRLTQIQNGDNLVALNLNKLLQSERSVVNEKSLVAKAFLTDNLNNQEEISLESKSFVLDLQLNQPVIEMNLTGDNIINAMELNNSIPLTLTINQLDQDATLTLNLYKDNIHVGQKQITNNDLNQGKYVWLLDPTFNQQGELRLDGNVQDLALNQKAISSKTLTYNLDTSTSQANLEVTIGNQERYELTKSELNTQIPIKVKVFSLDTDATGVLTVKINNEIIGEQSNVANGEYEFFVTGEVLARNETIEVSILATDSQQNQSTSTTVEQYNVENFLVIKEIDADFNISFSDNRQEGVVLSGYVDISSEVTKGWEFLQINAGDLWRWIDSVTFKFESGVEYKVPVTHQDEDNNSYTPDENRVHYSLELTSTEWDSLANQAFTVIPNRLKSGETGQDAKTVFYAQNGQFIYFEDAGAGADNNTIQTTKINNTVNINSDLIINVENNSKEYPYRLTERNQMTTIKGVAGGEDVKAGQSVKLLINGETFVEQLDENKTFSIDIPTVKLLKSKDSKIKATLEMENGHLSTSNDYFSSNIDPVDFNGNLTQSEVKTINDIDVESRPYFIRALFSQPTHNRGFIKNKKAGEAITIKYSVADPNNLEFIQAMNKRNQRDYLEEKHKYKNGVSFTEKAKQDLANILNLFSEKTKITFEYSEDYLDISEGINFVLMPMKNTLFGFAEHGENVFLNSNIFTNGFTSQNQGVSTILHETMHAFGIKHPFPSKSKWTPLEFSCPCGCGMKVGLPSNALESNSILEETNNTSPENKSTIIYPNGAIDYVLTNAEERTMLTLMSYNTDINEYGKDLRLYDLATLHYLFGVNENIRPEDNIYTFKSFNEEAIDGDVYIWDGAGNDTFNAKTENNKVYINLTPGSWNYVGEKSDYFALSSLTKLTHDDFFNQQGIVVTNNPNGYELYHVNKMFNQHYPTLTYTKGQSFIGYGTVIENAVGTDFDDTIIGNSGNNRLEGGKGNDLLVGDLGNDVLNGGLGIDIMRGGKGSDIYFVDNENDVIEEIRTDINIGYDFKTQEQKMGSGDLDSLYLTSNYILPKYIEKINLLGNKDLSLTINESSLRKDGEVYDILGNDGNNHFIFESNDSVYFNIYGGKGNDQYIFKDISHMNVGVWYIQDFEKNDKLIFDKGNMEFDRSYISLAQKDTTTYEITIGQNQYSSITLKNMNDWTLQEIENTISII